MFHPLLVPTYGMFLLYRVFASIYFIQDLRVPLLLMSITFVSTGLLPALSSYILMRTGFVKSMEMDLRKERVFPYLITSIYYLFAYYMLKDFPVPSGMSLTIRFFVLGATASILIAMGINFVWKISAHAVAMGGLTGALLALCLFVPNPPLPFLYGVLAVSGLVMSSRLKLEAHTGAQVYAGYVLGFFCTFILFFIR
jgi:membrane-associated phospholipid phosphatase